MLIDCELISYYSADELIPYPKYTSGERDDKSIYKYSEPEKTYPVLTVEQDIQLNDGRGIKQGFYQVLLSEDCDFLLVVESGAIKAKIPVVSIEQRKPMPITKQKVERKLIKPPEGKEWKAPQKLKNNKGVDSDDFIYRKAEIYFDTGTNSYVLIYERGNTKAVGVIKL